MTNLLASLNCADEVHVVIGKSSIAYLRIASILSTGAKAVIIADSDSDFTPSVLNNIKENKLTFIQSDYDFDFIKSSLLSLGRSLTNNIIDRLFITLPSKYDQLKNVLYSFSVSNRIPINTADSAALSTFTLLSTHTDGDFQFGVTTSGKGCKLASRIKRELVSSLPPNIGEICNKVGQLRVSIRNEDGLKKEDRNIGEHDDDAITTTLLNNLVEEFNMSEDQKKLQRSRWLSQIVEYYPLNKLADINIEDLTSVYVNNKEISVKQAKSESSTRGGSISLVGAGPGSVSLLTLGAFQSIFDADLILADKLVPQQVIDLIPQHRTKLFIARKFPGNAEAAQQELLQLGIDALNRGERVVRLKQGDPYIFGRGGEEYNFFSSHGFKPIVIPGLTSALAAPVVANIPVTHRDVADQVLICTGTGRRGALPNLPEFNKTRTTVFLMALHRIVEVIPTLINEKGWDCDLPVAIIERASSPDQRIIRTTLKKVAEAVEACGSRPPGLLVTGYACEVIEKGTDSPWVIEEGFEQPKDLHPILSVIESAQKDQNLNLEDNRTAITL